MEENQGIPVLISLSALASYDGTPDDPIRMRTSGTLFPGADRSLLQYKEIQEDQETARILEADIQLVLRKDQVTMNRIGDYSNTMLFKKNIRYETLYHTPYGDLNMSVFTKEARWRSAGGSGSVHLRFRQRTSSVRPEHAGQLRLHERAAPGIQGKGSRRRIIC